MKTQVMLDLETLGKIPGSIILSIGAVKFGDGLIFEEFYARIDAESAEAIGLVMDASTVLWWLRQSEEARREILLPGEPIIPVLTRFAAWLGETDADVWANSPTFDCELLAAAYSKTLIARPWKHWNERDYRTARKLLPEIQMERPGTHHNALDDARFQARYLMAAKDAARGPVMPPPLPPPIT